jgi:hypothetical protein
VPSLHAMTRKPSCLISCIHASPLGGCGALVGRHGGTKPRGRGIAPPIERRCGSVKPWQWATSTKAASRLAVAIEFVPDALLVEDEPATGRRESVSIVLRP